ncbi:MAG TPA: hypothetical protein PLM56_12715 [Cyclobacteriaceae bacterium]|jgi:hypothetical protein|nr:hypothetical protein [Cyclobacteriaceae bacterium]HRF34358.1 hypothetical protein [Cyclobacteriaceae bacterium]
MRILPILFLMIVHVVYSQDINELERRNGFKEIKLGMLIDSVKGAEFKKDLIERKEFPAKQYETKSADYMTIGDVPVKLISLKTYKGLIYEIDVITGHDPKVMRGLEKSYGKATYSLRTESYYWKAQTLTLVYKGHRKEVKLTYRSVPVIRMMYVDKGKQIEEVADDF